MTYALHPLAALVPEMTAEQFADLREDVRAHGLLEPIVLHEHMVLDGRHRLRACEETGISPRFTAFDGSSPVEFVISKNVKRRHLSASQLAAIAVEFLPAMEAEAKERQRFHAGTAPGRKHSGSTESECSSPPGRATEQAAALVGVSRASVTRAKRLAQEEPEMFEQVKAGRVTVTTAEARLREVREGDGERGARDEMRANAHKRRLVECLSTLTGFARGLDAIDLDRALSAMDDKERAQWTRSLTDALTRFRVLRSGLQKGQD